MNRTARIGAVLVASALLSACHGDPPIRTGRAQQRVMAHTYARTAISLRTWLLDEFRTSQSSLPEPFDRMTVMELRPPQYQPDWLEGFVDPGDMLADYKRLPPADRANDLLIEDATGDVYWPSEYAAGGDTLRFRCGFVVHFAEQALLRTTVEVYETVPTIWVGERWEWSAHGIGFGRYHDLRFVEPTVNDRTKVFELLDRSRAGIID